MARFLFLLSPFSTHNLLFYSGATLQFSHKRMSIPFEPVKALRRGFEACATYRRPWSATHEDDRPPSFFCAGMIPLWEGGAASLREDLGRPLRLEEDSPYADLLYRAGSC
jgi:hypothetical protein